VGPRFRLLVLAVTACAVLLPGRPVQAYGVLSHLALVDAAWEDALEPAVERRFGVTLDENAAHEAHACAWGGALAQDLGYYPGGSRDLADMLHYVKAGAFVDALLAEAQTPCDYAFALGALSHYLADSRGHALGVNRVVPIAFPRLQKRYGDVVTYAQDHKAHLRVEFGFDVLQVARGLYPSERYRRFIGFTVPQGVFDRALQRTYGTALTRFLPRPDRAVRSARRFVGSLFPKLTRVAWAYKRDAIAQLLPSATSERFVYNLSRAAFEKEWGREYDRPGLRSRVGAFLLRLVPKVGRLKVLVPKPPPPEGERIFAESFNTVLDEYRVLLRRPPAGPLALEDVNLDVGHVTPPGTYPPADRVRGRVPEIASR
jgi:hypothetical protein